MGATHSVEPKSVQLFPMLIEILECRIEKDWLARGRLTQEKVGRNCKVHHLASVHFEYAGFDVTF